MNTLKVAIFSTLIVFSNLSLACKFIPNNQTNEEKIAASQIAFVGTIIKIDKDNVTFKIDKDLKNKNRTSFEVTQGNSSCSQRYEINDQWLYFGNSLPSGSVLLKRNGQEINKYK